jgi:hypothetical protein
MQFPEGLENTPFTEGEGVKSRLPFKTFSTFHSIYLITSESLGNGSSFNNVCSSKSSMDMPCFESENRTGRFQNNDNTV